MNKAFHKLQIHPIKHTCRQIVFQSRNYLHIYNALKVEILAPKRTLQKHCFVTKVQLQEFISTKLINTHERLYPY